jgi:hypothetical protein
MWTISNRAVGVILTRRRLNETHKLRTENGSLQIKDFWCANVMNEMEHHDDRGIRKGEH